jgi:hypothetical protein
MNIIMLYVIGIKLVLLLSICIDLCIYWDAGALRVCFPAFRIFTLHEGRAPRSWRYSIAILNLFVSNADLRVIFYKHHVNRMHSTVYALLFTTLNTDVNIWYSKAVKESTDQLIHRGMNINNPSYGTVPMQTLQIWPNRNHRTVRSSLLILINCACPDNRCVLSTGVR